MAVDAPPPEWVESCREHFGNSGHRNRWTLNRVRAPGNRSFPTGYQVFQGREGSPEHLQHYHAVTQELAVNPSGMRLARMASRADKRVVIGPSDEDVAALRWVEDGWVCAERLCHGIGLRTRTGLNPSLRYGVVLDWLTRVFGVSFCHHHDGVPESDAIQLYGLDLTRICLEHNAEPGDIAEHTLPVFGRTDPVIPLLGLDGSGRL